MFPPGRAAPWTCPARSQQLHQVWAAPSCWPLDFAGQVPALPESHPSALHPPVLKSHPTPASEKGRERDVQKSSPFSGKTLFQDACSPLESQESIHPGAPLFSSPHFPLSSLPFILSQSHRASSQIWRGCSCAAKASIWLDPGLGQSLWLLLQHALLAKILLGSNPTFLPSLPVGAGDKLKQGACLSLPVLGWGLVLNRSQG